MSDDFGATLARLRESKGWSRQGLAERTGYSYQYVWEQETGRKRPTERFARACDGALGCHERLLTLVQGDDAVRRRTLLGVGTVATLETIRHTLTRTMAGPAADRADLEEWEAIAWEYGHSYLVTPAAELIDQLSADFLAVQSLIQGSRGSTRAGYCRVSAQLAIITARIWSSLSDYRQAWRWWRTARLAADASGDLTERMMCRGEEVVIGLYEHRPISVLLQLADEAATIGGDHPCRGSVGLWAGVAQANSMIGRRDDAVDALHRLNRLSESLPSATVNAESSVYGWPEYRLRHTESYVHTYLSQTQEAYEAQDRALALYPKMSDPVGRAQVQLHRASCLVQDGDIRGGLDDALGAVDALADGYRADGLVLSVAETVLNAVPARERGRPDVRDLAEVVRRP